MKYRDINAIMTKHLIDGNFGLPIAHKNTTFKREDHQAFLEPFSLSAPKELITRNGYGEIRGAYQIDIVVRKGTSTAQVDNMVDRIIEHFAFNLKLTRNDTHVTIMNSYHIEDYNGSSNDDWYQNSVNIDYIARPI